MYIYYSKVLSHHIIFCFCVLSIAGTFVYVSVHASLCFVSVGIARNYFTVYAPIEMYGKMFISVQQESENDRN